VADGTRTPTKDNPRTISALLEKIAVEDPVSLPLISDVILHFSPYLVVNHCFDQNAAVRVSSTLQTIAGERLSIDINHVGTISKHRSIEQSTSYAQHPIVARQKSSLFVSEMESIINALGLA